MDLTDFLEARCADLDRDDIEGGGRSPALAASIRTIVAAYRSVGIPVGMHQAAAHRAVGFTLSALAIAWEDHQDYNRAWAIA